MKPNFLVIGAMKCATTNLFVGRSADVMRRCYEFLGVDPLGELEHFEASYVSVQKRVD